MTSPWRPPWTTRSGREAIEVWIDTALARLDRRRLAAPTTVLMWELACVLRVETDDGPLFFKASVPRSSAAAEARNLISLMTHLPGAPTPQPLIVDDVLGWMLLPEHGTELRDLDAPHIWEAAARQYATLQIASIPRADALVHAGLPDLRGRRLFVELTTLFRHPHALNALTGDETDRLRRSSPRLVDLYVWLETSGLPAALVHGDFHGGSAVLHGDRLLFVNWPHASIGLPFLDLTILLHDAGHFFSAGVVQRLRDAYLDAWIAYGSPGRLHAIYALAQPLGYLHRAILENAIADQFDESLDRDDDEASRALQRSRVAYWLRQMLAALGPA